MGMPIQAAIRLLAAALLGMAASSSVQAGVFDQIKDLNEAVKERTAVAKDIEQTTEDVKSLGPEEKPKSKASKAEKAKKAEWHFSSNGESVGPVTSAQIGEKISSGQIESDTLVWREGMSNWKEAGSVKKFDKFFARKPPPLPGR